MPGVVDCPDGRAERASRGAVDCPLWRVGRASRAGGDPRAGWVRPLAFRFFVGHSHQPALQLTLSPGTPRSPNALRGGAGGSERGAVCSKCSQLRVYQVTNDGAKQERQTTTPLASNPPPPAMASRGEPLAAVHILLNCTPPGPAEHDFSRLEIPGLSTLRAKADKIHSLRGCLTAPPKHIAGWSSPVAREAHNLEVTGSNPVPAILGGGSEISLPSGYTKGRRPWASAFLCSLATCDDERQTDCPPRVARRRGLSTPTRRTAASRRGTPRRASPAADRQRRRT